ncbi:MAG: hypothetical protein JST04_01665 [Bdellovibrionales bacterium]|nr:hypothetical protein [Bdellovibrionales bacterium]
MPSRHFRITIALFVALAAAPLAASANPFFRAKWEGCVRLFDDVGDVATPVKETLGETEAWREVVAELNADLTPQSKQPFILHGLASNGETLFYVPFAGDFAGAAKVVARNPKIRTPPGGHVLWSPRFGYELGSEFREIGPLHYLVLDAAGKVVEVGAPSPEALDEFFRHLNGVEPTTEHLARISEVNEKILDVLRSNPQAKAKLDAFAKSRGWPDGFAEAGKLAYFDPSVLDVAAWAKTNGYSMRDLVDAGWYRLVFDYGGQPKYILNAPNSIKIPYLPGEGAAGTPIWRSRNLAKDKPWLPKYTSWQIDRAVNRRLAVNERLYNGWKLPEVKGKSVVITEGEFKCLVAEKVTGLNMFGIPGITEFDDDIARALAEAGASEYIIVLDRDPHAKALFRADEVTDSNRAAYTIARSLEAAGAKNVYVGILPEMANGEKLGIDDLVLKYGADPVKKLVAEARGRNAGAYAKEIGLDANFQDLNIRRSKVRKAIEQREIRNRRGGVRNGDPVLTRARKILKKLNRTYQDYLEHELNGARNLNAASAKVNSIRPGRIPDAEAKALFFNDGTHAEMGAFADDLLLLDYVPSDVAWRECRPLGCGQTPFTKAALAEAFAGSATDADLVAALGAADALALETNYRPKNFEEFAVYALAGQLTRSFPLDEYAFEFGARFGHGPTSAAGDVTLPLVIFKRNSGKAVAFANLHVPNDGNYWSGNERHFESMLDFLRGSNAGH